MNRITGRTCRQAFATLLAVLLGVLATGDARTLHAADQSPTVVEATKVVPASTAKVCEDCEPAVPCAATTVRPQDQLWAVSTRSLAYCDAPSQVGKIRFWKYEAGAWRHATLAEFLASDSPDQSTSIYVHGNQISHSEAFAYGWTVYGSLVAQAPSQRALRFVIFVWPAERIDGNLKEDVRVKAARTGAQGYYLAWLVDQMDPAAPLNLTGYSFGARIVTGALHLLGGGNLEGMTLSARKHREPRHISAVLMAAALDNDWLMPGHRHGRAMSQVDEMLLVNNGCDRALKNYWRLYCGARRRTGPEALGYTGVAGLYQMSVADQAKIRQFDVCCMVGSEHNWRLYWGNPSIVARIVPYVFTQARAPELAKKAG